MVEQTPLKRTVVGSSPSTRANQYPCAPTVAIGYLDAKSQYKNTPRPPMGQDNVLGVATAANSGRQFEKGFVVETANQKPCGTEVRTPASHTRNGKVAKAKRCRTLGTCQC
jgi:hypothetical protein